MKPFLIFLSLSLLVIFGLSLKNTFKSINQIGPLATIGSSTEAFDPALSKTPGFDETEKRISGMLQEYKKEDRSLKMWLIALNLIVTIATGLTTLITAISTAKNNSINKSTAIAIAIITFCATIINFSQGQVTTAKDEIKHKTETVRKIRDELEALKPEEVSNQLPRINRELDEV